MLNIYLKSSYIVKDILKDHVISLKSNLCSSNIQVKTYFALRFATSLNYQFLDDGNKNEDISNLIRIIKAICDVKLKESKYEISLGRVRLSY